VKWVLLVNWDEKAGRTWDEARNNQELQAHMAFAGDLGPKGKLLAGERLRFSDEAVEVRVKNGKTVLKDGPFAETREVLGGFYVVDAADRAEAVALAARLPEAKYASVVAWPVWEMAQG
jgi:hypothetical protein